MIEKQDSLEPNRKFVSLNIDNYVEHNNNVYRIVEILDFESIIGVNVETGRSTPLRVAELLPVPTTDRESFSTREDLANIGDTSWQIAEKRFAAIKPLLNSQLSGRKEVVLRAKEVSVDPATLYRWLKRYKAFGEVMALIPRKRGWSEGKSRIDHESEAVIKEVINDFYLTPQRPSVQKTILEVARLCLLRGIKSPSPSSIRTRISKISEKARLRGRGYKELAKNKYLPVPGKFPNATFPMDVIQIDHTPADIIIVDDVYRKPIGRPWITLAIDVFSRMVTGYYLSFDPPSETSVAMCVAHSIIPKEDWLALHKVDAEWPVWGVPRTIHTDNGADFRSDNFRNSCMAYGILHEFRKIGEPRYGGHIERLLGTLLSEIHNLPGTTFSSIKDRDGYDSEKHSALTKSEFEEWLVTLICKVYHEKRHSGIGMSPLKKWEIGVFGNAEYPGIKFQPRPTNRNTILLDFLPSFSRTIQNFGVSIDGLTYYSEDFRTWINALDSTTKEKRKFIFRRDPRDISVIFFFDPEIKQYFRIPFADQSLPSMSIWEFQMAKNQLQIEGINTTKEHQILRAITELRAKVDEAKLKTKKARRLAQKRVEHEKKISPANTKIENQNNANPVTPTTPELLDGFIEAYGGIS